MKKILSILPACFCIPYSASSVFFIFTLTFTFFISCAEKNDFYEPQIHTSNWLWVHDEKVENLGSDASCRSCHPPEGDMENAPYCSICHGTD